jgi:hypothetical protein
MAKPYSIDLRERVQAEVERGQSRRAAARRYDVSASFAVKLADRVSRTGSAEPARQGRPTGGGKLAPYLTALLEWVETAPDSSVVCAATDARDARRDARSPGMPTHGSCRSPPPVPIPLQKAVHVEVGHKRTDHSSLRPQTCPRHAAVSREMLPARATLFIDCAHGPFASPSA